MSRHHFLHCSFSRFSLFEGRAILGPMSFGLLAASSLISALPAQASVLVKPAILREAPAQPADEPANQAAQPAPSQNIVGIASETLGFSTLVTAIEAANIGSVLSAEGPLTVFAPIDAAFAALPADTLDALLEPNNRDLLVKLLYNHVAYGDLTSDKLSMGEVDTFDSEVEVVFLPTGVEVDGASVVQADIDASNGVIHAVDQVLLPAGFSEELQARIDGVAPAAQGASGQSPSLSQPPTATDGDAVSPDSASPVVSAPTEDVSTTEGEGGPVRALW